MIGLLFASIPLSVFADAETETGFRVQLASGNDSNPLEAVAEARIQDDFFYRIQGEGEFTVRQLPHVARAAVAIRGFAERYNEFAEEGRAQAEVKGQADFRLGRNAGAGHLEVGWRGRDYPDSTSRNFSRTWAVARARVRAGSRGLIVPRFEAWSLAFNQRQDRDQAGLAFEVAYETPVFGAISGHTGLMLGATSYQRRSLKAFRDDDGDLVVEFGPQQDDNFRFFRIGGRYLKRALIQLQYGYRSNRSNSVGGAFRRHEISWLLSRGLPYRISLQFYGNLQDTKYTDPDIDEVFVIRLGEEGEANDDHNTITVQLGRPLIRELRGLVRYSWFKNESILVGTFYEKTVWTLALSWETPTFSGF